MRVLMVCAEYAPFAKTGGLADMVAGLCRALAAAGHDVRVLLPAYRGLDSGDSRSSIAAAIGLGELQVSPVSLNDTHPAYQFRQATAAPGEPVIYLLDAPAFYSSAAIYGGGELEARRFALLAHGALRLCEVLGWAPTVLHCHDWHTALAPVLLRGGYRDVGVLSNTRTVLTLHNIGYQGVFDAALAPVLGLTGPLPEPNLNFLRTGIECADALTTVSPTHAGEILTPEYGKGLDQLLLTRRDDLTGILNGVDYAAWSPDTDPALPARYSAADLAGKATCRTRLLRQTGLADGLAVPVLGMVTRLAGQKGIELVLEALPPRLASGQVQAVILGEGEEQYASRLTELAGQFPGLCHFNNTQDERLARLIFAGSDAFLVPSLYEPCGLTQMYALRYGSVPVVRETGGLRDTVSHFNPRTGSGTGSVFRHPDGVGLAWAIGEILTWWHTPGLWPQLRAN
ncbi:MAG: glycogen synthase, partial [Gammaproteobacteria bacterium]|nr:glycogen synthase [Gammaproteobacteria bacterium]